MGDPMAKYTIDRDDGIKRVMPKYPIYVPSKGRAESCHTARLFERDAVPYRLVVEEAEADEYATRYPHAEILVLPFSDMGSVVPARNWIVDHAHAEGTGRHWQWDDNIRHVFRLWKGERVLCRAGFGIRAVEDFTDRYANVAIAGMNYKMFVPPATATPFYHNVHVYSCSLLSHEMPYRWRGIYNEDTDLCLQALSSGEWCTLLVNVFMADKLRTMTMKGGNTDELYGSEYDGRLRMARSLERKWPGVVTTGRRFERPQHVVKDSWRKFDTPLVRRKGARNTTAARDDKLSLWRVDPPKHRRIQRLADDLEAHVGSAR